MCVFFLFLRYQPEVGRTHFSNPNTSMAYSPTPLYIGVVLRGSMNILHAYIIYIYTSIVGVNGLTRKGFGAQKTPLGRVRSALELR